MHVCLQNLQVMKPHSLSTWNAILMEEYILILPTYRSDLQVFGFPGDWHLVKSRVLLKGTRWADFAATPETNSWMWQRRMEFSAIFQSCNFCFVNCRLSGIWGCFVDGVLIEVLSLFASTQGPHVYMGQRTRPKYNSNKSNSHGNSDFPFS